MNANFWKVELSRYHIKGPHINFPKVFSPKPVSSRVSIACSDVYKKVPVLLITYTTLPIHRKKKVPTRAKKARNAGIAAAYFQYRLY